MLAVADARARGLLTLSKALHDMVLKPHFYNTTDNVILLFFQNGKNAASLTLAEQYISAFKHLAKTNNTLILPANTGDISSFVAQALSVYKNVSTHNLESQVPNNNNEFGLNTSSVMNEDDDTSDLKERKKLQAANVSKIDIE